MFWHLITTLVPLPAALLLLRADHQMSAFDRASSLPQVCDLAAQEAFR